MREIMHYRIGLTYNAKKTLSQLIITLSVLYTTAVLADPAPQVNKADLGQNRYAKRGEQVFKEVWQEICKRNFDKTLATKFNKKILTEYLPQAKKCKDDSELANLINQMIKGLGQSHISVFPPIGSSFSRAINLSRRNLQRSVNKKTSQKRKDKKRSKSPKVKFIDVPADVGITPCTIDGKLYVLQLRNKFPAQQAGIRLGDQIIAIDGVKLTPNKPAPVSWSRIASMLLSGYPGTTVKITLRHNAGKRYSLELVRRQNGFKWFKLGAMPKFFSEFEAKMLPGKIGYIRFSAFLPEEISKISQAINHQLRDSRGLIIDLRDNVGGIIMTTQWLAGWLYNKPVAIGSLKMHGATLKPVSYPQANGYKKPLAILVNEGSFSCAELFPAAMQDAGAAKIFGSPTLGKCLPSQFLVLPSGFRLQTVFGDHIRITGQRVEGIGVTPDVQVKLDLQQLCHGKDSVTEAAREYLIKEK